MTKREQEARIEAFKNEMNGVKAVRTPSSNDALEIVSISMRNYEKSLEVLNGKKAVKILIGTGTLTLDSVQNGGFKEVNGKDGEEQEI